MPERPKPKRGPLAPLAEMLYPYFPDLKKKLLLASLPDDPLLFTEKVLTNTFFLALALELLTGFFFFRNNLNPLFLLPLALVYLVVLFSYLMFYPDAAILRRKREVDYEVLFAGRHLLIALKSGMPLFDALVGLTSGYGAVSQEFNRIVEKVSLGTPLSQAIREVAHNSPSQYFVRILMQISNSLVSGADVAASLDVVVEQISKEQLIQLKEYGQKLTPMVMFFMVLGIIIPSIGVVILTVLFSFTSGGPFGINSGILLMIFLGITIIQFLFLGVIETSRPKYLI